MSRGILINTLDTYIGTALYEEFLGENPAESPYEIYGTYHQKDDSVKPSFVKKMMKRSKPVLFRKYMREKMDCYIYDLHSGRLDDLKWAVWALTNEPLESEKTLIVISSVLSWGGNEHKMMEVKPKKKKPVEEGEEPVPEGEGEGQGEEGANEEEEKEDEEEEKKEEEEEEQKKEAEPEKEEKKEPKYDEEGNIIEEVDPNKKEVDEYGNLILIAQLDENGNEICPSNDDSFEYYFENEYIEMKNKEKKEKEEEERRIKAEANVAKVEGEEENKEQQEDQGEGQGQLQGEGEGGEQQEGQGNDEEQRGLQGSNSQNNINEDKDRDPDANDEEKEKPKRRIIKVKKIKPKIFKRIGYSEKEYTKRIPISFYAHFKEYEDYLLNLKYENLSIYIICAGIPYGGCETVFNSFFKSAWLQDPIKLPIYGEGLNIIPTIHIKDLSRIVKKLAEAKSESPYIFAIDKTKDKTLKSLISSISINIGSGQTVPIEYNKELIKNIVLKQDDFFIDKSKYEKNKLVMNITKHELSWTRFLGIDVMLKPGKFIDEEFEWHCKEGIPKNNKKLLDEFCSLRKLRPLKIILNCKNESMRKFYAEKLAKFYNIPTLNFDLMMEKLYMNIAELSEEEVFMNQKYFKLNERVEFLDAHPDYKNEANELLYDKTEILFECLKYLLNSNAALNRGYVLEGIPVNGEEVERIYYYKKEIVPEEGEEEEKPEEEEEVDEEDEKEEDKKEEGDKEKEAEADSGDKDKAKENDEEPKAEGDGEGEGAGDVDSGDKKDNDEEGEKEEKPKEGDEEENKEDNEEEQKENEEKKGIPVEGEGKIEGEGQAKPEGKEGGEQGEGEEGGKKKKKKKKVKKIKPKKYKSRFDKTLLPESVIDLCQVDPSTKTVDNTFWEVDAFYQENNIEILNLVYEDDKEDPEETFEMMRIYIERNGRPFNYFQLKDEDINVNRITYVEGKQKSIETHIQQNKNNLNQIEEEKETVYWTKMKERIEFIQKDREQLAQCEKVPTRKFLLINIMPTLTKGLLEVCKINPIDPIDYLADFLFTNSTDNK